MFAPFKVVAFSCLLFNFTHLCLPHSSCASDAWEAKKHFLAGYYAYLQHNYGYCADQFYQSLEETVSAKNKARLYLAVCQYKLSLKDLSLYHLMKVEPTLLTRNEQTLYKQLKARLQKKWDEAVQSVIWLSPFAGYLAYHSVGTTASTLSPSGWFYGVSANLTKETWKFSAMGENLSFSVSPTSNFSIRQGLLGVETLIGESVALSGKGTYISSTQSGFGSTMIGDLGANFYLSSWLQFYLEYAYSTYPKLSPGALKLSQFTGAFRFNIASNGENLNTLTLGSQTILTSAAWTQEPITGFTLSKSYERFFANFNSQWESIGLEISGWMGKEAFGVRNQGALVYTSYEEHRYGWGLGLNFLIDPTWGLQTSFLQEDVAVSKYEFITNTIFGGLFFKL